MMVTMVEIWCALDVQMEQQGCVAVLESPVREKWIDFDNNNKRRHQKLENDAKEKAEMR